MVKKHGRCAHHCMINRHRLTCSSAGHVATHKGDCSHHNHAQTAVLPMHRDLNVATSRSVFAGPYFESSEEKEKFGKAFLDMTEGFLALPICIPGTAVWRAKRGRLYILDLLEKAAARSKTAMKVGCTRHCSDYAHPLHPPEMHVRCTHWGSTPLSRL